MEELQVWKKVKRAKENRVGSEKEPQEEVSRQTGRKEITDKRIIERVKIKVNMRDKV